MTCLCHALGFVFSQKHARGSYHIPEARFFTFWVVFFREFTWTCRGLYVTARVLFSEFTWTFQRPVRHAWVLFSS